MLVCEGVEAQRYWGAGVRARMHAEAHADRCAQMGAKVEGCGGKTDLRAPRAEVRNMPKCVHAYMLRCVLTLVRMLMRACVHVCVRPCLRVCMRVYVHARCMCACMHACVRACGRACVRAFVRECVRG